MSALHRQLRRLIARQMPEAGLGPPPTAPQPPPLVTAALCKAVAAGWADRVSFPRSLITPSLHALEF